MNADVRRVWQGFWQLADPKIWIASTVPMVVGAAFAFGSTGRFDLYWFIVALIAVYCIEIGKNAVNEWVDYKSGVDRFITPDKRTPFSGGKKTIVDGKLTLPEVVMIAVVTFAVACGIGLYIMFFKEMGIFWIGIAGVLLSIFYSLPPFKLAYRGLGEVTVGLTFGPLIVLGIYCLQTGRVDLSALWVSIPIGILIANVLWINQFPDYEADAQGNKRNWLVRLGKEKGVKVFALLFLAAYLWFILLAVILRNPFWLLGLVSVPLAVRAVKVAGQYYNDIPRLTEANLRMVQVYQLTGLTMTVAAILGRFI
ncbi:MAG: prenyltransferase [Caldicoprobacter oshimai]|uniref:1,4-dihydroxy-2-naphthoate octaprenyltransferase n=1 Tax=Caldicoprobacter faecalis TaxID=937334 RepID=A0A1I5SRB0_9FIRM|nr:prenyltransferase [Caldicoprobacter faecalis]PZN09975.1 MAG: prenyltransferase [Caldicoprobacter oshimai]SFP73332.1 1,4-dihydroxy-2-naphthoate octaprenyltransferase [Caldicoprobacter faecalis]